MIESRKAQSLLLEKAIPEVQRVAREWIADSLDLPVVFVIDFQDRNCGKIFADALIDPLEIARARAINDGGVHIDAVSTFVVGRPLEDADKALSYAACGFTSLNELSRPGHVIAIVAAYGEANPFLVTLPLDKGDQSNDVPGERR